MATGAIVSSTYTAAPGTPGNGKLDVKYSTAADATHPTQYSVIFNGVPGAWRNVTAFNGNAPVTFVARNYQIQFRRTTASPADTPPPTQPITVTENQLLTLKIHYT
jgi:hypothetical protein